MEPGVSFGFELPEDYEAPYPVLAQDKVMLRDRSVALATTTPHETIYDLLVDADKVHKYLLDGVVPNGPTNPEPL